MPSDTLQWMLDKTEAEGITDVAVITNMQLLLTMAAIHTTTLTTTYILHDLELYPNPTAFDPYRFVRLRTDPDAPDPLGFKNREQYQFVSVTKGNMSFGFGRHAARGASLLPTRSN
jgi:cytochrome P450